MLKKNLLIDVDKFLLSLVFGVQDWHLVLAGQDVVIKELYILVYLPILLSQK